jgi:hypothetical protein
MTVKELTKEVELFKSDVFEHLKHIQHKFISTSGECEIDIKRPDEPVITFKEKQVIINNFNTIFDELRSLKKQVLELKQEQKEEREIFQHNFQYIGVIETVIEREDTEWDGKPNLRMLVQLEGIKEVYNILCAKYKNPKVGDRITFIFNADENKLMKIRKL